MDRNALKLVDMAAALRRDGLPPAGRSTGGDAQACFPYHMGTKGVHEVSPASYGDTPAALGFALTAGLVPAQGACLWVREERLVRDRGQPCGDGLRALGVDPGRLVLVTARKRTEALWAVEEAMKSHAVSVVLAEIGGLDFTASRRLALASEHHGSAAILILPHTLEGATAATARWRVAALPSAPNRLAPGQVGALRWQARLERSRNAPHALGRMHGLEFNHEALSLDLVPGLVSRQAPPPAPRPQGDVLPFARTG